MIALLVLLAAAVEHPCLADAEKLCRGVDPGGGRVASCLKKHEKEVSAECRKGVASFHEKTEMLKKTCYDDYDRFCGGVVPGRGSVLKCLINRYSELSPECRKDMAAFKKRFDAIDDAYHEVMQQCAFDLSRLCPGVETGGGATEKCLKDHQRDLQIECKKSLQKWLSL